MGFWITDDSAALIIFSVSGKISSFLNISFFKTRGFIFSFIGFAEVLTSSLSITAKTDPFETLSPILTSKEEIFPANGDGTSTLDLSLSKVTTGSFFLIVSPDLTKISIISTFSKSPISGTVIFVAIITVLFIPQFNPFSAM